MARRASRNLSRGPKTYRPPRGCQVSALRPGPAGATAGPVRALRVEGPVGAWAKA